MSPFTGPFKFALAAVASAALAEAAVVEQIFNFTSYVSIENSIIRPNGHILFSTLSSGNLYSIDPSAESPQAEIVASMPGATALTGFAQIGTDKYAVAGGVRGSYQYANETIYTIDFSSDSSANGTIGIAATLPDAVMLNGAAALADDSDLILVGDARVACVWRVDVATGAYEQAFAGDYLAAPANASVPIGVNGLKVRAGYAWFTNTGTGVFGRVPIDARGTPTGDYEVVATVATSTSWDDFDVVADDGTSVACQSPASVVVVSPAGALSSLADDDEAGAVEVLSCSSVTTPTNGTAYVTTKGDSASGLSGQILRIAY